MIFWPRQMVQSEAVPQHDIGVLYSAVPCSPGGQAVTARRLVDEFACGEPLLGMERCHPDLMLDETAAPTRRAVRCGEGLDRGPGFQLVGDRRANPVPLLGVD